MRRILGNVLALSVSAVAILAGAPRTATEKPGPPPKSGFYSFWNIGEEFGEGIGNVSKLFCEIGTATQPPIYTGNMLIDCDGEVPHNETSIAVNPNDPKHVVGAYHSYQVKFRGATA
ncbi:MAG TPA: hypothetical protein VLE22_10740, partial [Bryobacteraceae bacterium]|nr:hypothetical protein [Bryobacteraceae bacterium]